MENTNKNFFDSMADMQKQAVETFTNAANTMQKAMFNNQNVNFDSETFKKWYDSQMAWFNQLNGENKGMNNGLEFFNNWMSKQMELSKQWSDMNQSWMQNWAGNANNMNMGADMNNAYTNMMNMFNSWKNSMTNSYNEMMNHFNNGNTKEYFSGMFNNAEMYMKSFEFWMPMLKAVQDKTFTPDMFKQLFNAEAFKGMMDKMFGMQPDWMKNMMENNMNASKENMNRMMDMGKGMYDNFKNQAWNNMPDANGMLNSMMNNYNNWMNNVNSAVAPLTKLMPANGNTEQMEMMRDIANQLAVYNMKNAQLQYMMYSTGMKAMENVAENLYGKVRNGEEKKSFTEIYQNWLSTSDKYFVELFETEAYSKIMSETSSMQLKLKKNIDTLMEKAMGHLPLINRTEMDELYKTIYELKKRINTLEKQIDSEGVEEVKEPKAAKKSAKNA